MPTRPSSLSSSLRARQSSRLYCSSLDLSSWNHLSISCPLATGFSIFLPSTLSARLAREPALCWVVFSYMSIRSPQQVSLQSKKHPILFALAAR